MIDQSLFQENVSILFKTWNESCGASELCADVLKAVHRGEGTIDLGRLCILDKKNYAAVSYFLDRLQASDIPHQGIREFLSEDEFAALFELQRT